MTRMKTGMAAVALFALLAAEEMPVLAGNLYSIQVAASPDKESAQETSEQMNRMGYDSFVRLETVPGKGQWYRVYVQRFGSKALADKEAVALRSVGLLTECYVRELKEADEPKPTPPRAFEKRENAVHRQEKAVSGKIHFLHVASFKEKGNAEKTVNHLEKNGQKAFFAEEGSGADKWFRTYIGEFADDKEAQRAGSLLKEKRLISYFKVISFDKGGQRGPESKVPRLGSLVH